MAAWADRVIKSRMRRVNNIETRVGPHLDTAFANFECEIKLKLASDQVCRYTLIRRHVSFSTVPVDLVSTRWGSETRACLRRAAKETTGIKWCLDLLEITQGTKF